MRYTIKHPRLALLNMDSGDDVMALDAALRQVVPTIEGWSYSFADDTLTIDAPPGAEESLAAWGKVSADG